MAGGRTIDPYAGLRYQLEVQRAQQENARRQAELAEREREAGVRETEFGETRADREQANRNAVIEHLLTLRGQRAARGEAAQTRAGEAQDRLDADRLNLMQSPALMTAFNKQAPEIQRQLMSQALERFGVNPDAMVDPKLAEQMKQVGAGAGVGTSKIGADQTGKVALPSGGIVGATPPPQAPRGQPQQPQQPPEDPGAAADRAMEQALIAQLSGGGAQALPDTRTPVQKAAEEAQAQAYQRRQALAGAGAVHYDPELGGNVRTAADGSRFVVGAGDPSVGAIQGNPAVQAAQLGPHMAGMVTPDRGVIKWYSRDPAAEIARQGWSPMNLQAPGKTAAATAPTGPPMQPKDIAVPQERQYQAPAGPPMAPPTGPSTVAGGTPRPETPPTPTATPGPWTPEQGLAHRAVGAMGDFLFHKGAPFGAPEQPKPPPFAPSGTVGPQQPQATPPPPPQSAAVNPASPQSAAQQPPPMPPRTTSYPIPRPNPMFL